MAETKFIKRKKPNYIRAIILVVILIIILFLFYNMDNLISGFIEIKE
jgi:hypothetical protein